MIREDYSLKLVTIMLRENSVGDLLKLYGKAAMQICLNLLWFDHGCRVLDIADEVLPGGHILLHDPKMLKAPIWKRLCLMLLYIEILIGMRKRRASY